MTQKRCTHCDGGPLEPGFIVDSGQSARGFAQWQQGELKRGIFGGAKTMGRPKWEVEAYRCQVCSHLELFTTGKPMDVNPL